MLFDQTAYALTQKHQHFGAMSHTTEHQFNTNTARQYLSCTKAGRSLCHWTSIELFYFAPIAYLIGYCSINIPLFLILKEFEGKRMTVLHCEILILSLSYSMKVTNFESDTACIVSMVHSLYWSREMLSLAVLHLYSPILLRYSAITVCITVLLINVLLHWNFSNYQSTHEWRS